MPSKSKSKSPTETKTENESMNRYGIKGGLPAATKIAVDNFNNLTDEQFAQLETLDRDLQANKTDHALIDGRIIPLFYDLGLFVFDESIVLLRAPYSGEHIEVIWADGLGWLLTLQAESAEIKFNPPDLATTLQLLTAVLQGCIVYGADYWYDQGLAQKLISHLVQFRQAKK